MVFKELVNGKVDLLKRVDVDVMSPSVVYKKERSGVDDRRTSLYPMAQ